MREVRELGESIVLVDQHPSQISIPALGNTYCTIALNMKHSKDINALAEIMRPATTGGCSARCRWAGR